MRLAFLDVSFVDEQDRNVVADGINPSAFKAFQRLTTVFQDQRFLAERAGEDVEQVLRNHDRKILPPAPPAVLGTERPAGRGESHGTKTSCVNMGSHFETCLTPAAALCL